MSQLDDMVREMLKNAKCGADALNFDGSLPETIKPDLANDPEFQETYIDHCMESLGLVYCVTDQRFIDDDKHDIKHIFAYNAKEIREKSIIARMSGDINEGNKPW